MVALDRATIKMDSSENPVEVFVVGFEAGSVVAIAIARVFLTAFVARFHCLYWLTGHVYSRIPKLFLLDCGA